MIEIVLSTTVNANFKPRCVDHLSRYLDTHSHRSTVMNDKMQAKHLRDRLRNEASEHRESVSQLEEDRRKADNEISELRTQVEEQQKSLNVRLPERSALSFVFSCILKERSSPWMLFLRWATPSMTCQFC